MSKRLKAIYQGGAFLPQESCNLPDASSVELIVEGPFVIPPVVKNHKERMRVLKAVVRRMKRNSISGKAPRLTRDALHERG